MIGSQSYQRSLVFQCREACFQVGSTMYYYFFTSHALTVYSNPHLPNGIKINCQDTTALESYWVGGRGHQSTVPRGQDVNLIFESLQKVQLLKRFCLHIFNQPAQCSLFTEQKSSICCFPFAIQCRNCGLSENMAMNCADQTSKEAQIDFCNHMAFLPASFNSPCGASFLFPP